MGKSKLMRFSLLLVLAVAVITNCAPGPAEAIVAISELPRVEAPSVDNTDLDQQVAGNHAFALDLLQALSEAEDGNLFYSPYSISIALAMTYAGARGETEREMAQTLHFILPQDRLHPAFNALDQALASRGKSGSGEENRFQLNMANAIWGQVGYEFLSEFLDVLAENYGAGLRLLDFGADPEAARQVVNEWISDETEEKIEDMIPQGVLDAATRLVLANAIYFNAQWAHPFQEASTHNGLFQLLDGEQVEVPMMSQNETYRYAEGSGYQVVELPYVGNEVSMVIFLPEKGHFEDFERSLDAQKLEQVLAGLEPRAVALSMPKFEYESSFSLSEQLIGMGMPSAFGGGADFSGMDGSLQLCIKEVLHKAFVSVDEIGTEAAAATVVVLVEKGIPESEVEMAIDHPFIFMIRDMETGTILFVGRVINPIG
jgi:serpin B